jgi:hypothetical protein
MRTYYWQAATILEIACWAILVRMRETQPGLPRPHVAGDLVPEARQPEAEHDLLRLLKNRLTLVTIQTTVIRRMVIGLRLTLKTVTKQSMFPILRKLPLHTVASH